MDRTFFCVATASSTCSLISDILLSFFTRARLRRGPGLAPVFEGDDDDDEDEDEEDDEDDDNDDT